MLAINTAFMTANLALSTKEGKVVLRDIDAKSKHSENVLKTIELMCEEAKIDILDLQTIAVVVGPGSFTGLRIGTAIAKALGCVNKQLKFISLSSLELMAYIIAKNELNRKEKFVCVLNALSNLYFVVYFDENGIKICEERMIDKVEYSKIKSKKFGLKNDLGFEDVTEIEIDCKSFLDFACMKEKLGEFVEADDLLPMYLRLSQAEDNMLKKCKKDNKIS